LSVAAHRASVARAIARRLAPKDSSALKPASTLPRLFECEAGQHVGEACVELLWHERRIAKRDQRRYIAHAVLRKDILFLEEAGFHVLRPRHDARARERCDHISVQVRPQRIDHRREQHVDLVVPVARQKLTVVAVDALHRVAAVDSAASLTDLASLILRAIGGEL
jgi:hypothetical protein